MFFVGLFVPLYGSNENLPICRFGRLAMLPNEPFNFANEGLANLYLMETEAFGGNSGSPAFFYFPPSRRGPPVVNFPWTGKRSLLLAGVVKGYFYDYSKVLLLNSTAATPVTTQHLGVTAIVPAYYIHDMLFSPDEKQARENGFKATFPKGF